MQRVVSGGEYDDKQSKSTRLAILRASGIYRVYGLPVDVFILEGG